jgi:hypothetical protein
MFQNPFSNRGKNIQKNFNHIAYSTLTLISQETSQKDDREHTLCLTLLHNEVSRNFLLR